MRSCVAVLVVALLRVPSTGGLSLRASKTTSAVTKEHAAAVREAVEDAMEDQELDRLRSQLREVEARAHKALRAAQASTAAAAPAAAAPAAAAYTKAHPARFAAAAAKEPNPFSAAPGGAAPMGAAPMGAAPMGPMGGMAAPNPFSAGLMKNNGGMMDMSQYVGHSTASMQGGVMGFNPNKATPPPHMYKKFQGFDPKMAQQVMLSGGGGMGGGMDPMGGMQLGPLGTAGFMRKRMKDEQGKFADSPMGAMGIPNGGVQPNLMAMMAGAGTRGGIWGANPNAMGGMGGMSAIGLGGAGAYAPIQYQVPGMGYQNPESPGGFGMYPTPGARPMSSQSPYSAFNYAGYDNAGFPLPHPGIPSSLPVYEPPKAPAAA